MKLFLFLFALFSALSKFVAAESLKLRMATAAPGNTIWQSQFDQFADAVAEETQGRVEIDIFYNSQLGSEQAVLPQVMRGRVDIGAFSVAAIADQMPEAYLVSMLFFYDNKATRSCILDAVRGSYRDLIAPIGIYLLDWSEVGTGQLAGTQPYLSPKDVQGLKIGVSATPISNMYWENLGAYPVMTPVPESVSNVATGLIDVLPTVPVFYMFGGVSAVAPVLTKLDYVMSPAVIVINQTVWNSLSDADRDGINRALARYPAAQRSHAFFEFEQQVLDMHVKSGGTLVELTPEQRTAWVSDIDAYYKQALSSVSAEGRDFFNILLEARTSCEN